MRTKLSEAIHSRVILILCVVTLLVSPNRLQSQASLFDPTFKVGHGANGAVYSIVIQDDGKIVVGGEFTRIAGQQRTNLARLNSDGLMDFSFPQGTDGPVFQLLKQADGKILVGGAFTNLQGVARQRIGRLLTNGVVDLSFDPTTNISANSKVFSLAAQPDGKILATTFAFGGSTGSLKRFEATGQLDLSFVQTNEFDGWFAFAVCLRTNGSILTGGGFQGVNSIMTPSLALFSTNGVLDTNFISDVQTNFPRAVSSLVPQMDGSVLVGGSFLRTTSANRTVIAKLTSAMVWDTAFNADAFDPNYQQNNFPHVAVIKMQPDGKYLVGGYFQEVGGYWRRDIVRLDSQGKVDPCFDPGIGLGDDYSSGNAGVKSIALQADGNIVAGGDFVSFTGGVIASASSSNLVRFLPQSDCNATRVYLLNYGGRYTAIGTCALGGTNYLQQSTNLVDWFTLGTNAISGSYSDETVSARPYVFWFIPSGSTTNDHSVFFRIKKEY